MNSLQPVNSSAGLMEKGIPLPRPMKQSSVRLAALPAGLEFPASMSQRISFDPNRRRLTFSGFMAKSDYDRLCALSTDDEYLKALEDLFCESSRNAIAVEIGIDQVMGHGAGDLRKQSLLWRWGLQWVLMVACFVASALLVWWWLKQLI